MNVYLIVGAHIKYTVYIAFSMPDLLDCGIIPYKTMSYIYFNIHPRCYRMVELAEYGSQYAL